MGLSQSIGRERIERTEKNPGIWASCRDMYVGKRTLLSSVRVITYTVLYLVLPFSLLLCDYTRMIPLYNSQSECLLPKINRLTPYHLVWYNVFAHRGNDRSARACSRGVSLPPVYSDSECHLVKGSSRETHHRLSRSRPRDNSDKSGKEGRSLGLSASYRNETEQS